MRGGNLSEVILTGTRLNDAILPENFLRQFGNIVNGNIEWVSAISNWLPGRSLSLIYQASRNGFASSNFHQCCDNRGATLVIVRCNNGFVFGGYAAVSWNSNGGWIQGQRNSFLFTLKNPHNIPPTRYNCKNPQYELRGHSSYGPSFGNGNDLHISTNANANSNSYCNLGNAYEDATGRGTATFTGNQNFQVSDYEVFTVQ